MNTRRTNRFALTFLVLGLATTAVAAVRTGDAREHDVTKVMHRTVDIDGLEIFYRGSRPERRADHPAVAWVSDVIPYVPKLDPGVG